MKPVPTHSTPETSANPTSAPHPLERLSALVDGDPQSVQAACKLWRDDPEARRAWHSYHLIGDLMRSEDLSLRPQRDADFLAKVRERLAAEPVVLAPLPDKESRRQPWLWPAAAAAGVAMVAGVLVVARVGSPGGLPAGAGGAVMATAPGASAQPLQRVSVDGQGVLRDPRLEELVRQHQASSGVLAVPLPGTLRPQAVSVDR